MSKAKAAHTCQKVGAGVLWLRGEQLEWRLQWQWRAVAIWKRARLRASSSSSINHRSTTGCQWINTFHYCKECNEMLSFPFLSVIVFLPNGQRSSGIRGALIRLWRLSFLITFSICLWDEGCSVLCMAAGLTDVLLQEVCVFLSRQTLSGCVEV